MIELAVSLAVLFPSVILHEVAHGAVAYWLGDPTAKAERRLSLNPLRHISWFGTFILPGVLALTHLPVFGYAKPVPINPRYFSDPSKDMAKVALAGPLVNVILATLSLVYLNVVLETVQPGFKPAVLAFVGSGATFWPGAWLLSGVVAFELLLVNLVLTVFNLLPVPPLDGSRILYWLLPADLGAWYYKLERYGLFIVFGLLYFDIFEWIYQRTVTPLLGLLL